jgi:hypothetical protein
MINLLLRGTRVRWSAELFWLMKVVPTSKKFEKRCTRLSVWFSHPLFCPSLQASEVWSSVERKHICDVGRHCCGEFFNVLRRPFWASEVSGSRNLFMGGWAVGDPYTASIQRLPAVTASGAKWPETEGESPQSVPVSVMFRFTVKCCNVRSFALDVNNFTGRSLTAGGYKFRWCPDRDSNMRPVRSCISSRCREGQQVRCIARMLFGGNCVGTVTASIMYLSNLCCVSFTNPLLKSMEKRWTLVS